MSTEALFRVRVEEEGRSGFRLLRLLPSRERLVVVLRESALEGLLRLPEGSFRRLANGVGHSNLREEERTKACADRLQNLGARGGS